VWARALKKEILNVGIAFEILKPEKHAPPGWAKTSGHLVFYLKISLEQKACWVLDGHLTPDAHYSTYVGVVSRESVRIALTYAALNGVDVCAADIRNTYIQAPSSWKDFVICGPEFGLENVGKTALIHRALYGGKMAGHDSQNHLRECMTHLGFKSCLAIQTCGWGRQLDLTDILTGSMYSYILMTAWQSVIEENMFSGRKSGNTLNSKRSPVVRPTFTLAANFENFELENGNKAWDFGSSQYIQAAVKNVENYLKSQHFVLPTNATAPLWSNYRPKLDIIPELSPNDASHYQSLIGILRWMVELGRVDICCEVSMLSSHLALPREGHLQQVYHMFTYLKHHHNAEMVFDPSEPEVDQSHFERRDWTTSKMTEGLS
jgi:hypothetical protein